MISNSGCDERGTYYGGVAGDQTGTEWQIRSWYSRPWNCVLRHPDAKVRATICRLAKDAANNNRIGYDQYQRTTFWEELQKVGYEPSKIKNNCESDCSAGVAAIVKATGYLLNMTALKNVSKDIYTGNERSGLKAAGFTVLTDSKYLTSDAYLLEGDILLNDSCHTAINVSNGYKAGASSSSSSSAKPSAPSASAKAPNKTKKWTGIVNATDLNVRSWAGTENRALRSLKKGTKVEVCDTVAASDGSAWYYIKESGKYGFVSADYVVKKTATNKPAKKKSSAPSKTKKWTGKVTADELNVRSWAGTENPRLRSLKKGTKVDVCDSIKASDGSTWYYIKESGKYGFVHSRYITKK